MKRDIKLRAWSNTAKTMHPVWLKLDDENGEYSLMQYTGLKDKNGKEIYEGDIVSKGSEVYFVEWWSCMWAIKTRHYGFKPLDEFVGLEVIGNIFENPELL